MSEPKYKLEIETLPDIKNYPLDSRTYKDWKEIKKVVKELIKLKGGLEIKSHTFSSGGDITISSYVSNGIGVSIYERETTDENNKRVDMEITLASDKEVGGLAGLILFTSNHFLRRKQSVGLSVDESGVLR